VVSKKLLNCLALAEFRYK